MEIPPTPMKPSVLSLGQSVTATVNREPNDAVFLPLELGTDAEDIPRAYGGVTVEAIVNGRQNGDDVRIGRVTFNANNARSGDIINTDVITDGPLIVHNIII